MKKLFYFFLLFGWLLINFRPAVSQSITMQENWNVALTAGEICQDLQVMNGYAYTLIYRGYWVNFDHYRVEKRDASGNVVASVNKDDVKYDMNMLCYDNKVLLTSMIDNGHLTGVKLYSDNLSLLKDTTWTGLGVYQSLSSRLDYYGNYIWWTTEGCNLATMVKIYKINPNTLASVNDLTIDSTNFSGLLKEYDLFNSYGGSYYLNPIIYSSGPTTSQKIKFDGNLQILNADPPENLIFLMDLFGYNSSIYYLGGINSGSGGIKLIKKDTNNFTNAWEVSLTNISTYRRPGIHPNNNVFLFADGDGTVRKINPNTGSNLGWVNVASLSPIDDVAHYFGKINCGQDYPFMIIGPTGTNPSEPFKIYLLDPASLGTLSIKTMNNISPNYKIIEAGDKIYIINDRIIELSVLVWPSINLVDLGSGQVINPGNYIINLSTPNVPDTVIFNSNGDFGIKNVSGSSKTIKCKKVILNQVNGASNCFVWDTLYNSSVSISGPLIIASDSIFSGFRSLYSWNNHLGWTSIRYVFFNQDDPTDSTWYQVTYDIVTGLEENQATSLKVYPNPVKDYLYLDNALNPVVEIFDALGNLVLTANATRLDLSTLPSGLYLCRIKQNDNGKVEVRKFLKQ
ncbi:MAG: T9SS type A sorting domain-containing protein [Patescibacteria group bacterium]